MIEWNEIKLQIVHRRASVYGCLWITRWMDNSRDVLPHCVSQDKNISKLKIKKGYLKQICECSDTNWHLGWCKNQPLSLVEDTFGNNWCKNVNLCEVYMWYIFFFLYFFSLGCHTVHQIQVEQEKSVPMNLMKWTWNWTMLQKFIHSSIHGLYHRCNYTRVNIKSTSCHSFCSQAHQHFLKGSKCSFKWNWN